MNRVKLVRVSVQPFQRRRDVARLVECLGGECVSLNCAKHRNQRQERDDEHNQMGTLHDSSFSFLKSIALRRRRLAAQAGFTNPEYINRYCGSE